MENSPLARLAPELRNSIYGLVFGEYRVVDIKSGNVNLNHPLTRTCRKIRDESLLMYYSATTFHFSILSTGLKREAAGVRTMCRWLRDLGGEACASIKGLHDCWWQARFVNVERIKAVALLLQGQGFIVEAADMVEPPRPGLTDWKCEVHKTILDLGLHTRLVRRGSDSWIVVLRDTNELLLLEGGNS